MYIEINERWQVYAGRNRRRRRPWVHYARFGGTRELNLFGWCLTLTRASEPTDDVIEPWVDDAFWSGPWVDDAFWSGPWVDDEVKGGVGHELQSPKR